MYCVSCAEYQEQKCNIEPIYASGMLKNCPAYNAGEDVIAANGCNLQIRMETIFLDIETPSKRICVYPVRTQQQFGGWVGKYMICFNGQGTVRTYLSQTLPNAAVWFAWHDVKRYLEELNNSALLEFLPLIDRRINFDYTVIKYSDVPEHVLSVEKKAEVKPLPVKQIVIPSMEGKDMLEVKEPGNSTKDIGDQMDLFAL